MKHLSFVDVLALMGWTYYAILWIVSAWLNLQAGRFEHRPNFAAHVMGLVCIIWLLRA